MMIKESFFKILDKMGCCGRTKIEKGNFIKDAKPTEIKKKSIKRRKSTKRSSTASTKNENVSM